MLDLKFRITLLVTVVALGAAGFESGSADFIEKTFLVTVDNQTPVVVPADDQSISEGALLSFNVATFTDDTGDTDIDELGETDRVPKDFTDVPDPKIPKFPRIPDIKIDPGQHPPPGAAFH